MPVDASETFFSPMTLLWLGISLMAVAILFGSINRRRARLTESLRQYVDQNQPERKSVPQGDDDESA